MKKRLLAMILAVAMCLTLLPTVAFAEEETVYTDTESITVDTSELADSDELLEGYITDLFGLNDGIMLLSDYGSQFLTDEFSKSVYDAMKAGVEAIASGETSSSVITMSGGSYTFSDFDTDNLQDAAAAYKTKYSSCISEAFDYLLIDCPYDLYWFDKTTGITTNYSYSSSGSSFSVTLKFTFCVATAYQDGDNTTVDATKVAAAKTAKATAEAIVAKYASYSDAAKLAAYKGEICTLVSYATDYASASYGDIWQLVYVFDGDEDTNVVCEGYSKAFQYLCDLSTFDDEDTYCYTVSGTMSGGTGAGAHMWNIICLDGVNYLVDVTNSDSGTVGQNGGLFLVCADDATTLSSTGYTFAIGSQTITYAYDEDTLSMYPEAYLTLGTTAATHTHTYGDPTFTWATNYSSCTAVFVCTDNDDTQTVSATVTSQTTNATCTNDGNITYTATVTFNGTEYTNTKTVEVTAAGHIGGEAVKEKEVAATCTTDGSYDSVIYCTVCNEEISRETVTVPATGHTEGEAVKEKEIVVSCTTDGSYDSVVYCTVCNEEISRETVTVPATGHTEGEAVKEKEVAATCTTDGSYDSVVYCTVCNEEISRETVTVPATGHTEGEAVREKEVAATCTTDGSYDSVVYCTVCNEEISRETVTVPATGHTEGEAVKEKEVAATCTTDGSYDSVVYCTVCDEEISRETVTVPATGHTEGEAVKEKEVAATCTTDGSYDSVVYCTVCDEEISRETVTVPATGHTTEVQNAKDATCTEDGYTGDEVCTVCGEAVTTGEVIPATGHTAGEAVKEKEVAATCTTDGSYDSVVYCTVCNEEISRETVTVPATGHTAGEAVKEKVVAATCTTDGSYDSVVYCTVCDEEISRETVTVPATGHTAGEAVKEKEVAATCTTDGSYDSVVYCTVCNEEISCETVTVPATGHTEGETVKENEVAATCTEEGSYDGVVYCTVCGEELSRETVTVPATGHTEDEAVVENEVAATCTEDGSYDKVVYCTVCGEEISRETITVTAGHTAGETVKENEIPATCTTEGSYDEVVKCSVCGEELSRTAITTDVLGHTWDNGVVTTAATATTDGVMTYTCTVCGATKTEAIPATGTSGGGTTNISIEVNFTSDDNVTPTTLYIVINVNVRSYQWYSTSSSTAAGTLIEGATSASYTPSTDAVGTTYYYCVVTTEDGMEIVSEAIPVAVTEDSTTPVPTRPTRPTTTPDYYEETSYKITTSTATASHGTIKISDSRAYAGETVTITVSPDDGYELDELIVKNASTGKSIKLTQKSSTKYTFTMPAAKVTIEATFVKIEEEEETEVLGTLTKVVPTTPFTDISDSRFKDAIAYVYDAGLMNGITTTTFDPEGTLTRAMVATVLYRLAGEPDVIGTSSYSDVAAGLWYSDAITWATQNGIVNGYGDSSFGPNDPVTREQLATMLYRYASSNGIYVGNTFPLDGFIDGDAVRDYAKAAMEWAVANSTIVTRATATLNPGEYATRAEVAQALSTLIA